MFPILCNPNFSHNIQFILSPLSKIQQFRLDPLLLQILFAEHLSLLLLLVVWLISIQSILPLFFSNHLSLFSIIFFTIGATLTLFLILSFIILSCLVLQHIQPNILIFITLTLFSYWFLIDQHYVLYNILGHTAFR